MSGRLHLHVPRTLGERLADRAATFLGSWRFILAQTAIVTVWVALNVAGWWRWHWDAYPFILLNLAFSTQAAYTGPILLLAANRQAELDRRRDQETHDETHRTLELLAELTRRLPAGEEEACRPI